MPVIIDPADVDAWLDTTAGSEIAQALLRPYPPERMTAYPVSRHVNSPKNDGPECVEPMSERSMAPETRGHTTLVQGGAYWHKVPWR